MKTKNPNMDARERLIQNTQDLLWERGYVGTSPSAIQQKSGVGQGSMYHHFEGKHDLALAAIQRNAEEMQLACEMALSGTGTAFERISGYLLSQRDVMRGCRIGRLAQDPEVFACDDLRAPVKETFARVRARLCSIIEEGRERSEFDLDIDPTNTAEMIVAVVQGAYVLSRADNDAAAFSRAVAGVLGALKSKTKDTNRTFNTPPFT